MKDKCEVKVKWRAWHGNRKSHEAKGQTAQRHKVQQELQKGHWLSKVSPCSYRMKGCNLGPMDENSLYRLTPPHTNHLLSFLSGGFLLNKVDHNLFSAGHFLTQWILSVYIFFSVKFQLQTWQKFEAFFPI